MGLSCGHRVEIITTASFSWKCIATNCTGMGNTVYRKKTTYISNGLGTFWGRLVALVIFKVIYFSILLHLSREFDLIVERPTYFDQGIRYVSVLISNHELSITPTFCFPIT